MPDHHFERKVPGGKLVVADITDDGSHITAASISGDFFLEPEEAFHALNAALVGAPVTADTDTLEKLLDAALTRCEGTALHGFSTRDIAQVTRRALLDATDLTDLEWTVYRPGPLPTPLNVALDEHLLSQVPQRGAMLRFWEWHDRAVVFGSYQSYRNELNQEGVERHGITPVRRISGGGAMFMEGGNCVTYSLYVPESAVAGLSYVESYEYLDQWVIAGLRSLGVNAWYVPINDITSDGGKIGGAAQKRVKGAVLHHTTMSYDINAEKMSEVLRVGKVKLADKGIRSAAKRVDPLRRQTGVPREQVIDALLDTFTSRYPATMAELPQADIDAAQHLVDTKFGTPEWTHRVP
ncbi:lipoate--protein ligase family protein [Corynebacterium uberis]|uniref:lipoate--protein ligase family protein n=1 Tax=Corynebacterium TaxID=1716 RepID=UPI001D0A9652|nr:MULTISPECIES: biotin/lipoate A/B protein ligase family protein [Corynebacterium]MCZ9308920.1 lipoate--protein ligase family protein [Corynebacterium sp. c6VSa_13]UDL74607.1 lipoate--protein ligase family protein [Corynebacterium uberis]UDL76559.1 lipoate--protein ligase family protein [Corynebacterium uberis]UDL78772.1 lipoate--protein ligase family protein [Corynebacterium uberis]UDL81050.1 lipoate--protein ligase family protein [Corynebacterium uberis]